MIDKERKLNIEGAISDEKLDRALFLVEKWEKNTAERFGTPLDTAGSACKHRLVDADVDSIEIHAKNKTFFVQVSCGTTISGLLK